MFTNENQCTFSKNVRFDEPIVLLCPPQICPSSGVCRGDSWRLTRAVLRRLTCAGSLRARRTVNNVYMFLLRIFLDRFVVLRNQILIIYVDVLYVLCGD
jgi:hypothetical protein